MKGLIWNVRGLGRPGRALALTSLIRQHKPDFIGLQETKKPLLHFNQIRAMTGLGYFQWHQISAIGSAGGILVGANADLYIMTVAASFTFSTCVMIQDKKLTLVGSLL